MLIECYIIKILLYNVYLLLMKYEINEVNHGSELGLQTLVCMLTGLSLEEVQIVTDSTPNRWGGQMFVKVFQSLGFNTNMSFTKFDPKDTDWWAYVYYDNVIYDSNGGKHNFKLCTREYKGKFYFRHIQLRITSMLQVWI